VIKAKRSDFIKVKKNQKNFTQKPIKETYTGGGTYLHIMPGKACNQPNFFKGVPKAVDKKTDGAGQSIFNLVGG